MIRLESEPFRIARRTINQEMVFRTHVYERETIRGTAGNVDFFRHESLTIDDCLMMLVAHYQTKTAVISDG